MMRKDVVAQAVSLAIASQTEQWTSLGSVEKEPEYISEQIDQGLGTTLLHNERWGHFFEVNGISPHTVFYKDLVQSANDVIQGIVDYVGVDAEVSIDLADSGLGKQGTEINKTWAERFKAELRLRG